MAYCLFVSGTDTEIGKTFVSAMLCGCLARQGDRLGYYKPVQSGAVSQGDRWLSPDVEFVKQIVPTVRTHCSYALPLPAAPQLAAEQCEPAIAIHPQILDADFQAMKAQVDVLIVEGAGGLAVPLAPGLAISDLICRWKLPLILVSRPDLGTINHTTLSLAYARQQGIEPLAIAFSYRHPQLEPDTLILATAPRFIQDLNGPIPYCQLPYMDPGAIQWDVAAAVLTPVLDAISSHRFQPNMECSGIE